MKIHELSAVANKLTFLKKAAKTQTEACAYLTALSAVHTLIAIYLEAKEDE